MLGFRSTSWLPHAKATLSRFPAYLCETLGNTSVSGCWHYGGARQNRGIWDISEIQPYVVGVLGDQWLQEKCVRYHSHCHVDHANSHPDMLYATVPMNVIIQRLGQADLRDLCQAHGLTKLRGSRIEVLKNMLINAQCHEHVTIFVSLKESALRESPTQLPFLENVRLGVSPGKGVPFPPQPLSLDIKNQIIEDFCEEFSPQRVIEDGCAVCGSLTIQQSLLPLVGLKPGFFEPLCRPGEGITKCERLTPLAPHREIPGPVMLSRCSGVCPSCLNALRQSKCPRLSLANGGWLGEVPSCLQDLSFAEKLMVSRMYHNRFIVRVGCGQMKLKGNVILFTKPMQKVYAILPPPKDELQEILAVVFFGPTQPTIDDYKRIPLLVRHKKVLDALSWLKLNHSGYQDLSISLENLSQYREGMALLLQPPPPPPAPLSYSPPSPGEISEFGRTVTRPLETALDNLVQLFQDLEETPNESLHYFYSTRFLEILGDSTRTLLQPILYPTSRFEGNILRLLHGIRTEIKEITHNTPPNVPTHPTPAVDVAPVVAAMNEKLEDLKRETQTSLKSFAEAVKASAPSPLPPPPRPTKSKISPPSLKGNRLPQAVIRFRDRVDAMSRPSFTVLVPELNNQIQSLPNFPHVQVVGVKWTSASNLLVRAQAPSSSVLVAALEEVHWALEIHQLKIKDVIPNTKWSRVTLSHVYTGKEENSDPFSAETLHSELTKYNPAYASLTIRQPPSWVRNPQSFKDGQVSSLSFAFEDPDGALAHRLIGSSLTAFGNLRCAIRAWVTPKKPQQGAGNPSPPKATSQVVRPPSQDKLLKNSAHPAVTGERHSVVQ